MINLKIGMSGRYKLAVKKNGETVRETGWFKNLITNQGMDLVTTSEIAVTRYCQVGSSSAAPAFTDTALGARIAGVDSLSNVPTPTIDTTNRYVIYSQKYTFSNGAAAGNIAEVGVGTGLTASLFSRALVLDSMGNPTTITVLSDEDLVVIYELWVKQPTEDFISVVGDKTLTIRACNVNSTDYAGWLSAMQFVLRIECSAFTGAIGGITAAPGGTKASTTSFVQDTYVAGSWTRTYRITWGTGSANFAILSFAWGVGPTYWQAQLSEAIPKNSTQTFRLGVRLTWSRDSGPA